MHATEFMRLARANPVNTALLDRLPALGLPQCHLVAGCLFQAVWNARAGQDAAFGVQDYDVFYYDDADLSWEAEDAAIRQTQAALADLIGQDVTIELRNQARVHLWYPQRFGGVYPALRNAREGIDRYLVACTCVGVDVHTGALYAPHGLADLAQGVLRVNPLTPQPALFAAKARSYQMRWPWLRVQPQGGAQASASMANALTTHRPEP